MSFFFSEKTSHCQDPLLNYIFMVQIKGFYLNPIDSLEQQQKF